MTPAASPLSPELIDSRDDRLLAILRGCRNVVVAFSGGIDSTVVAKAAFLALGEQACAVTADSASVPRAEIADAKRLAEQIGITHRIVSTEEFEDPNYLPQRRQPLLPLQERALQPNRISAPRARRNPIICSGDQPRRRRRLSPRPTAAKEHAVRHPLQEAGFNKADVRSLAQAWELPTWDKPASPCLSSRLAPGVAVTANGPPVGGGIVFADATGLRECRVRLHQDELARIEYPLHGLAALTAPGQHEALVARFRELGFRFITLDLEGFRTGNLNVLVSLDQKRLFPKN